MQILFFDTETTGKIKDYKLKHPKLSNVDNWPRVIQLGWQVFTEKQELVSEYNILIKPDGWVIPNDPNDPNNFWTKHGYSTEKNMVEGFPMVDVLKRFLTDVRKSSILVAHNMEFDDPIIQAEVLRYSEFLDQETLDNYKHYIDTKRVCTKDSGTNFCKLKGPYGFKWPTLTELYAKCFNGGTFDGAHDALADVTATAKCFFVMLQSKALKYQKK